MQVSDVNIRAARWDDAHTQRAEMAGMQATAAGERLHASLAGLWDSSQRLQACLDDFSRSDTFALSESLQQTREPEDLGLVGSQGPSVLPPPPAEPEGYGSYCALCLLCLSMLRCTQEAHPWGWGVTA